MTESRGRGQAMSGQGVSLVKIARFVALGTALLGSLLLIGVELTRPIPDPDYGAYRDAASRLLAGEPLYPHADPDAGTTFRYAPWFAVIWIPFAVAGQAGVLAWQLLIAAAAVYVTASLWRLGTHAAYVLAALSVAQVGAMGLGNVEVLIAALLVSRRADALSVGIAASLKVYPILLVLGFVADRRWRDVAVAAGTAVLLWAPAILLGLDEYVTDPGGANGMTGGYLWDVGIWPVSTAALMVIGLALALKRSRWTLLAVAAALPWMVPRYTASGLTYVFGVAPKMTTARGHQTRDGRPSGGQSLRR